MGSGGSKHTETIHHYHTEYVPDPETVAALAKAQEEVAQLEDEAREMSDPNHFTNNVGKLFDNFIEKVGTLSLTDIIEKKPGEIHVGFVGPVTAGKTTLCNTLYGTSRPVALGHCTTDCEVIFTDNNGLVVWDMFGADNDFKYFDPATLSFVKNLDYCVILFDSDVAMVSWIIRTIHTINPSAMVIVRTKVDQCGADSERTVDEEKAMDGVKVQEMLSLGEPYQTYAISAHNVMYHRGEEFDWNVLREKLYPTRTAEADPTDVEVLAK